MTRAATHNKGGNRIVKPVKAGPGLPCPITQQRVEDICKAVKDVYVQTHVAGLVGIAPNTLSVWLSRGREELESVDNDEASSYDGIKTHPYAYLYVRYHRARAELVKELCCDVRYSENRVLNHGAQFLIERAFRAEFGSDSLLVQQLVEKMTYLENMITNQNAVSVDND